MSSSAGATEQIIESHEPIESANLFVDALGSQQVAYPPPRAASSHGANCSLQTRRRSSTYRLSCVRELISITRVYTRSTRDHRPMLSDYASSCGSWSPYSATGNIPMALSEAIIATYMTIHMARSPGSTQRENCVSLPGVPGGSGNPAGVAFRQRRARGRFAGRAYPPCQGHRDAGVALARAGTPP